MSGKNYREMCSVLQNFPRHKKCRHFNTFSNPCWGKLLTWTTGILLHHFFFSTFLVLRKHSLLQSSAVFLWNQPTQLWSHWGKKEPRHLSTNPTKQNATGRMTNQCFSDLKSHVSAQINRAEAVWKLKSDWHLHFHFSRQKNLPTICVLSWNLISWEHYFLQLNLPKNILVGNSPFSLLSSAPATCVSYTAENLPMYVSQDLTHKLLEFAGVTIRSDCLWNSKLLSLPTASARPVVLNM